MTAVDLLHLSVYISKICLLPTEVFLRMLHDKRDQDHGNREDQDRDQRHKRADGEHHDQHADQSGNGCDHLCSTLV